MIKRGYNIYYYDNILIKQMLELNLIQIFNNELVITQIGNIYLEKIMNEKSLLFFRYLSSNKENFDSYIANLLKSNKTLKL